MQQNIYFRKHIWERFKDEDDKSDLINRLLEEHYDDVAVKKAIGTANPVMSPAASKTKQDAVKEVFPDAKPITYKKTGNWGA